MFTPKSTVHQTLSRAHFKMLTPSNAPKRPPKTFFYRQIFNANPAIMLVIDPEDGRIIEGNQAACQYYGYDAQTLARMYIHQINTLTFQEVKEEMYLAYTLQKNFFNFKHRLSTGEIREVEVYSGPIQVRGKPLLYSIIHDITPLKMTEIALRESERKYLQVIEHVDASICVVQDEKFVFGNHIFFEWLGITPNPFSPLSIQTLPFEPAVLEKLLQVYTSLINNDISVQVLELQVPIRPHETRWYATHTMRTIWQEAPAILTIAYDITERKATEEALHESEERYRQLFEAESDAIFLIDNQSGKILEANSAAVSLYGFSRQTLLTMKNSDLSAEPEATQRVTQTTPPNPENIINIPLRWHKKQDGTVFPVEITGRFFQWQGREVHIAAIRDITFRHEAEARILAQQKQLEEANARLKALANKDPLTALFNRRAFDERLKQEMAHASRQASPLSVVLVDIDFFKTYNDTFGHPAGDEVLQSLANLLEKYSRTDDFVARYGGEEFILLLPHTTPKGAIQFANRCRQAIESHPWPRQGITASFGIATLPLKSPISAHELVTAADRALYQSKKMGRNRVTHAQNCDTIQP